jgi:hypothetical protein
VLYTVLYAQDMPNKANARQLIPVLRRRSRSRKAPHHFVGAGVVAASNFNPEPLKNDAAPHHWFILLEVLFKYTFVRHYSSLSSVKSMN